MHFVDCDGTIASADEGLLELFRRLRGVRRAARFAGAHPLIRRSVHRAYWFVSRHRGTLSRLVPDVPPTIRLPDEVS